MVLKNQSLKTVDKAQHSVWKMLAELHLVWLTGCHQNKGKRITEVYKTYICYMFQHTVSHCYLYFF